MIINVCFEASVILETSRNTVQMARTPLMEFVFFMVRHDVGFRCWKLHSQSMGTIDFLWHKKNLEPNFHAIHVHYLGYK